MIDGAALGTSIRPNTLIVDLSAVAHNVRQLRRLVGPRKQLFAALKGNAYGFGLIEVARESLRNGIDALSVVHLADAIALRAAGITAPILLYGGNLGDPAAVPLISKHDLITTLVDHDSIELYGRQSDWPIHAFLKVDVGLERLGVYPERAVALAKAIRRFPQISLDGVYTHVKVGKLHHESPVSDLEAVAPYLDWQLRKFRAVIDSLQRAGVDVRTTLAASSPSILLAKGLEYEALDPGRLLYGLLPPGPNLADIELLPAFHALRSRLIQVKSVVRNRYREEAGFEVRPGMRIGIIPMGSADGLSSVTSGQVLVHSQRVDLIGTFYEHARIDLTDVPEARAGDEVIIVGCQASAEITTEEVVSHQRLRSPAGLSGAIRDSVERIYLR